MQKGLFRSSNKWDAATDMLANKHKLESMQEQHGRKKRKYKYTTKCILHIHSLNYLILHTAKESIPTGRRIYETRKKVREKQTMTPA